VFVVPVSVLFVNVSVVALPTRVSVVVGNVRVPVLIIVEITGAVNVLFVSVSVVTRPMIVSDIDGNVRVPVLTIVAMTGLVRVLFVNVSVVFLVTIVSVTSGNVSVLFAVCDPNKVVLVPVVPAASNLIVFVLSELSYTANVVSTNDTGAAAGVCQFAVVPFVAVNTWPVVGAVAALTTTSVVALRN